MSQVAVNVPAWAKDAVFYQVFPDRFAQSDQVPKPANVRDWEEPPTQEDYYGGDLLGIAEHLDHLVGLGITAIYLNPVFQSACNHRYHTHDFEKVDPLLGGNAALRTLIDKAHDLGVRVMLDGVFNHAGRGFFQFNDILENGSHSPWLQWFVIDDWPLSPYDNDRAANYACWLGNRALPKFNTDNPEVREFIMRIAEYWVREYGIDGWRLDVPSEITTCGFWEEFCRRVRHANPDIYLVGEVWHEAREWVGRDRFDATMNYPFAAATIAFAAGDRVSEVLVRNRSYSPYPGTDAVTFADRIQRLLDHYDWETTQAQYNLLDSHDTPRLLSVARGDKATLRLATLFQMTYPGTPSVYYGDEIALRGTTSFDEAHQDQDARWPFPWRDRTTWDLEMLEYFRAVIALRHAHPVLRRGQYRNLYAHGRCYAFVRQDDTDTLAIVLNAAEEPAEIDVSVRSYFADGTSIAPIFGTGSGGTVVDGGLSISVPARAGVVVAAG